MSKYDSSLTVFSPEGHLMQVEHAHRAVEKGTAAVAIRSPDAVVLAVERKQTARLQDPRSIQKIFDVDDHIICAFAGLTADARVLIDRTRLECQSYRLTYDVAPSVEKIARTISNILQEHTQSGGTRPFGVALILAGYDQTGTHIFLCDPAGVYTEWKGLAIGNNAKTLLEFMEKRIESSAPANEADAINLAKEALSEVVESVTDGVQVRSLAVPKK